MRFTSLTDVVGKGVTKVPLAFNIVNYVSAKDLIEARRLGEFYAESVSADISARAEISAQRILAPWNPGRFPIAIADCRLREQKIEIRKSKLGSTGSQRRLLRVSNFEFRMCDGDKPEKSAEKLV